jgi:hypothetical protein
VFDPTQRLIREGHAIGVIGASSVAGLADGLRWVPLAEPAPRPRGPTPPVGINVDDGRRLRYLPAKPRVVIPRVPHGAHVRVRVRAIDALGRPGPAARRTLPTLSSRAGATPRAPRGERAAALRRTRDRELPPG